MKKIILILLSTMLIAQNNCDDNPVKPENHSPFILTLTVFPDVIGPQDSAIVICNAMDPDADTLVYDWITDGRVKIKGTRDYEHFLYHTYENSRIVYPKNLNNIAVDTLWVQCIVRDVKDGSDGEVITFILKQDLGGD
jgi:hypothetical protein